MFSLWVFAGCVVEWWYRLSPIGGERRKDLSGLLVRVLCWPATIYVVARRHNF